MAEEKKAPKPQAPQEGTAGAAAPPSPERMGDPSAQGADRALEAHPVDPAGLVWLREIMDRPWRVFWLNLVAGTGRGLGFALGFTLLSGLVLAVLFRLLTTAVDVPLVGGFLADILTEIQRQMGQMGRARP